MSVLCADVDLASVGTPWFGHCLIVLAACLRGGSPGELRCRCPQRNTRRSPPRSAGQRSLATEQVGQPSACEQLHGNGPCRLVSGGSDVLLQTRAAIVRPHAIASVGRVPGHSSVPRLVGSHRSPIAESAHPSDPRTVVKQGGTTSDPTDVDAMTRGGLRDATCGLVDSQVGCNVSPIQLRNFRSAFGTRILRLAGHAALKPRKHQRPLGM